MKSETLVEELEELIEQIGYSIRKERGTFMGSHCIVEGDKLVVINKSRPLEFRIGIYARVLREKEDKLKDVYVKPVVRKRLTELWERQDKFEEEDEPAVSSDS